jgi:hypothetical protein
MNYFTGGHTRPVNFALTICFANRLYRKAQNTNPAYDVDTQWMEALVNCQLKIWH